MNQPGTNVGVGGAIIAGGQASRMGFVDKPLLRLGPKSLLEHVIYQASPQVSGLILNVNRNGEKYAAFGLPIVNDLPGFKPGPLRGIYSAMQWYRQQPDPPSWLAVFPADVPGFPRDLVDTLLHFQFQSGANLVCCRTGQQLQPLFSLWSLSLVAELALALERGMVGPRQFLATREFAECPIKPRTPLEFVNINTPADLSNARHLLC